MENKTFQKDSSGYYMLTEVVSVVSHQLKTPLSVIKGYLEVLISEELGNLTEKQREYLEDALENTNQMINLVRDILDVARIEAKEMKMNQKSTDLTRIVETVVKEFSFFARAKNCELSLEIAEKIPVMNIDPLKIKQVVSNLISNAIAYNKRKGKVKVSLFKKWRRIVFCCEDTGIGIADKEKSKIFTKFYRSDRALVHETAGSGLGLFISKAIIEKSGGRIWFESKKDKGSTFCFSLPVRH